MGFLRKFFKPEPASSREVAKERLQLVLVHDRAQISPGQMEALRDEIITVISRHVPIDRDNVNISLTQTRHGTRLQADIPLTHRRKSAR